MKSPALDIAICFIVFVLCYFITYLFGFEPLRGVFEYSVNPSFNMSSLVLNAVKGVFADWFTQLKIILALAGLISFAVTTIFYIACMRAGGSLQSMRPVWWGCWAGVLVFAIVISAAFLRMPEDQSGHLIWMVLLSMGLVSVGQFHISTLIVCELTAPGAGLFKS